MTETITAAKLVTVLVSARPHIVMAAIKEDHILVDIKCAYCMKIFGIKVREQGLREWLTTKKIQAAMPELTADERELLISGTCSTCWDAIFSHDDEEASHDTPA